MKKFEPKQETLLTRVGHLSAIESRHVGRKSLLWRRQNLLQGWSIHILTVLLRFWRRIGQDEVVPHKVFGVSPRFVQELDPEHCYQPAHHLDVKGCLVQGALVEQETFGQMEQIRTSYLNILGKVASLRAERGVDLERATETPTLRASKVDRLRRELDESNKKARRLDEALQDRDHAKVQVEAEK
ncbi:uncharacterized protein A4U43_C02F10 [Asparagus officinalis]|uniref:Uncharacterized protein n=1 Tax=Asparagus officinalis TaxID=4686 RepID=A0A5P1FFG8_ASPOF|nr:uncharacterized protein A4U43_C02F10 [Asparagus officinalis]